MFKIPFKARLATEDAHASPLGGVRARAWGARDCSCSEDIGSGESFARVGEQAPGSRSQQLNGVKKGRKELKVSSPVSKRLVKITPLRSCETRFFAQNLVFYVVLCPPAGGGSWGEG